MREHPWSFIVTPEIRKLWEGYAVAKMQAEDSLLLADGMAAAKAFYAFLDAFRGPVAVPPVSARRADERRGAA